MWDIKGPLSIFNRNSWVDTIHFTCPQSPNGILNITVTNDNILPDLFLMFLDDNRIRQRQNIVFGVYVFINLFSY